MRYVEYMYLIIIEKLKKRGANSQTLRKLTETWGDLLQIYTLLQGHLPLDEVAVNTSCVTPGEIACDGATLGHFASGGLRKRKLGLFQSR